MTFQRYVAIGDSFTEGVGDADPTRPNGCRGWADRVAEVLAAGSPGFGYANLAIRGRKLPTIIDEQVGAAIDLAPDLVTIHGGGNDVLRPKLDLDGLAATYDEAVGRLAASGAHVVMFTVADPGLNSVIKVIRGRTAIFNEWVREIADKHDATVVDLWRMRGWKVSEIMDEDRLHLNPVGHQAVAIAVLDRLGVPHDLVPLAVPAAPELARRAQRQADLAWARTHLAPWVHRRITGRSSGDGVTPKRPGLSPIG
jgi:lysophospholipase L1-like esterase